MRGVLFLCFLFLACVPEGQEMRDGGSDAGAANDDAQVICETDSELCTRLAKQCGAVTDQDNCGAQRTVDCGGCTLPEVCGGGGTPNICGEGCAPQSDEDLCRRLYPQCGDQTATDNCGTSRTLQCNNCILPETCGGGSVSGECGAVLVCSGDDWCWENPVPQGGQVRGLHSQGANDVWAVGDAGLILHYDGQRWTSTPSGVSVRLEDVWANGQEAWAVGWESTVLRWNNSTWSPVPVNIDTHILKAVSGVGNEVWVVGVGQGGTTMLHWDGSQWSETQLAEEMQDVFALTASDIWAVGYSGVRHFTGSSWESVAVPQDASFILASVWAANANEAYIVGDYASARDQSTVLKWDGNELTFVETGCGAGLHSVWGTSTNDVWAVGNGRAIVHWTGNAWDVSDIDPGNHLYAVSGVSNDVWAAGAGGQLYHWEGSEWAESPSTTLNSIQDVFALAPDDVWAATSGGILHKDERGWRRDFRAGVMRAVWAASSTDAWAAGGNEIYHFDGSSWSIVTTSASIDISDLWGTGSQDIWAVGSSGGTYIGIMHYDGRTWSDMPQTGWSHLNVVWGSGPNDVWAAGGKLYHYDGVEWTEDSSVSGTFSGLWGSGPSDVWLSGGWSGQLYHYDGNQWTEETGSGATDNLRGISGTGPNDVWFVEQAGRVIHWDGQAFTVEETIGEPELLAISVLPETIFVAGSWGAILRKQR